MSRRVVILTEIIAPYRIPVFNALARQPEIDLHVIFLSRTDETMRRWPVYENEIQFSYEVLPSWRRRVAGYNILVTHSLAVALRRLAPQVLVCGGYNYLASWQALSWAKQNRVPFFLWSESTGSDQRREYFVVELLKRKFLRGCHGFIVPGRSAACYLEKFGVDPANIFTASNAIDVALFSAHAEKARKDSERVRAKLALPARYFLFVGRLIRSKGVLELLEAYGRLPSELRSEIGVVFAGDGPLRSELEVRAREIYPGNVHFAGFLHREELARAYSLAECFVFPTHSDPWGLVVNEAMACGLPIICTEVAGCAANLVRTNGILVQPRDVGQLAEAMRNLATNASLRQTMARESELLIRQYSPEICAAGFAQAAVSREVHV